MNTENHSTAPDPGKNDGSEIQDTVIWIINVVLKMGAGYLAKVLVDVLF